MVTLEEAKNYLRVDSDEDDALILDLIEKSERQVKDISRLTDDEFASSESSVKVAVFYTIAYYYEHREQADMNDLNLMIRALVFGIREEKF